MLISQEGPRGGTIDPAGAAVARAAPVETAGTMASPLLKLGRLTAESARCLPIGMRNRSLAVFSSNWLVIWDWSARRRCLSAGIGVALSIQAFLREKLQSIAILKTVGGDTHTIIAYLGQAVGLGFLGGVGGIGIGVMLQSILPQAVSTTRDRCYLQQIEFFCAAPLSALFRSQRPGLRRADHVAVQCVAVADDP